MEDLYPVGADDRGFWLDDENTGIPFLERARALGVKIIAVHKGLPLGPHSYEHSTCADIGWVARRYPDLSFLVYHSGFVPGAPESAYDATREDGSPYGGYVTDLLPTFETDHVAVQRAQYREAPDPHFRTYGPKSRREFLNLMRWQGG